MSNEQPSPETVLTECEPVRPSMSRIGLVAYCALPPNHAFVRVPNEPGRWVMVHRCVVDMGCDFCKSVPGEPCKRGKHYGVGTHTARRYAHSSFRWAHKQSGMPVHKPRIRPSDLEAADAVMT